MAAIEALLGGGFLLILALALLPSILMLVAFVRMGAGLKALGEAVRRPNDTSTISVSLASLSDSLHQLAQGQAAGKDAHVSENQKELAVSSKAMAESMAGLAKQAELAVQWYVHSLQSPEPAKPKK